MARKYFGTDGMRGEANKDLTIDLVTNLGLALGYYLKKHRKKAGKPRIILGTDKSNERLISAAKRIYDKISFVCRIEFDGSTY